MPLPEGMTRVDVANSIAVWLHGFWKLVTHPDVQADAERLLKLDDDKLVAQYYMCWV